VEPGSFHFSPRPKQKRLLNADLEISVDLFDFVYVSTMNSRRDVLEMHAIFGGSMGFVRSWRRAWQGRRPLPDDSQGKGFVWPALRHPALLNFFPTGPSGQGEFMKENP
jgi:hypothetical protein